MDIYWKKGARVTVDAVVAETEMEKIRKRKGDLTNQILVEAAAKKNSPLHGEFEWDDTKAAQMQRESRASELLRGIVKIQDEDKEKKYPTRRYSLVKNQPSPHSYVPTEDMLKDPDMRAKLLDEALRKLMSWRIEYRHLNELIIVFRSHDEVLSTIGEKQ